MKLALSEAKSGRPDSVAGKGPDPLWKGQTVAGLFHKIKDQFAGTQIGQTLSGQLSALQAM
jgi:hypothetical protein